MKLVLLMLGIYYFITGIWPLMHMKSFLRLTGFKKDQWLVRTVALLLINSSLIFIKPSIISSDLETAKYLAIMNIMSLIIIDTYYSLRGIIRKIYLIDAAIELIFFIAIVSL